MNDRYNAVSGKMPRAAEKHRSPALREVAVRGRQVL
jgi:hypothetical protein